MLEDSSRGRARRAGTVLIVDDDLDALEALAKIVSEHERLPLLAMNGRDALEVLSRVEGPCLILLDLFMPVMDGFQFLRALERYRAPGGYPPQMRRAPFWRPRPTEISVELAGIEPATS